MSDVKIFYNPGCSKCRTTLGILKERQIDAEVVEYLEHPPTAEELREVLAMLGTGARSIIRTGEPEFAELGLDDPSLGEDELIDALAAHPILIQRPIVIVDGKAIIGRPPEKVFSIL
jgi:arsenate reductase